MFCATCNLHYPDHLNYCRRCGKALVHTVVEAAIESLSCTRCGARVGGGENFCQQCGYRLSVKSDEAVIGACYHCGISWRNDWLFCKTCGLDRDHGLLPPISAPAAPASFQSNQIKVVEQVAQVERVYCPECAAEAKPYSRYCESCGINLEVETTSKPWLVLDTSSLPGDHEKPLAFSPASDEESELEQSDIIDVSQLRAGRQPVVYQAISSTNEKISSTNEKAAAKVESPLNQGAPLRKRDKLRPQEVGFSSNALLRRMSKEAGSWRSALRRRDDRLDKKKIKVGLNLRIRSSLAIASVILGLVLLSALSLILWLARNRSASSFFPAKPASVSKPATVTAGSATAAGPAESTAVRKQAKAPNAPDAIAGMVYVPRAEFQMGRARGDLYASPPLTVVVGPFFIDRTEVTNEEYLKFVEATGHTTPSSWRKGTFKSGEARYPVVNVSWVDAMAYAKWAEKRLPTEAEWEYAARGDGRYLYPWGDDWKPGYANADRGSNGRISAVGSYSRGASPFGALDMCGNVWELTSGNLFDYSDVTKLIHPGRVIRGGAYDVPRTRATTTYRGVVPPEKGYDKTGFRCVRDVMQ